MAVFFSPCSSFSSLIVSNERSRRFSCYPQVNLNFFTSPIEAGACLLKWRFTSYQCRGFLCFHGDRPKAGVRCYELSTPYQWRCFSNRRGDIPSPAEAEPLEVDDGEGETSNLDRILRESQRRRKLDVDPLEVDDDEEEAPNLTKYKIFRESQRMRKVEEEHYKQNRAVYREAMGLDPEGEEEDEFETTERREGPEIITAKDMALINDNDDLFSAVDVAVAHLKKREQLMKRGRAPVVTQVEAEEEDDDDRGSGKDVDAEDEEEDGEEERGSSLKKGKTNVAGATTNLEEDEVEEEEEQQGEPEEDDEVDSEEEDDALTDPSFDLDFSLEEDLDQIKEPTFRRTLSELLDEARVVPILVDGDQDVEITGIQYDPKQVSPGNMFVCCPGSSVDGHSPLAEAAEKGAVVIVASMEVSVQESVKAVVVVEETSSVLSALSAAFYENPSKKLLVIGVVGNEGNTTTAYLLKSMYEAMGHKTGLLGTIANYVHGKKNSDTFKSTLDAVSLQGMMATMVHNSTDVCILEVSPEDVSLGRCKEVDFDIAVFTSLINDQLDLRATQQGYENPGTHLFEKMVDPKRHFKVVNIDEHNAPFFIAKGNPDVPVVTFSMENKEADVYALEVQLSLFETDMLVHTPRGNVEISSGLLGRHNVYGILAAVAVGIAINAPLEEIVQGIEEVDAVPGRCELIDEEQAFAVIVDHARTPDALSRLLDTVRECGARRLITVVGCEGDCERGKRPVMAKIATDKSEVSILTSDNPSKEDPLYILDDMLAGVGWSMKEYLEHSDRDYYPPLRNGHRLFVHDIRPIAVRAAVAMGEEGDAVVIAGKGHETFQIVNDKKEYLDDREECREALQHVDALHAGGIDTSEFPWRLPESH